MAEQAAQIAEYIIGFSQRHGDPISNLKLQKLLYYSQAWFLALFDTPLFNERIEAWVHGPVVPPVYGDFKAWSWTPIVTQFDPDGIQLPENVKAHVQEVLEVYGGMSAYQLEQLTHSEEPWLKARGNTPPDEPSTAVISHDDMKAYYRSVNAQENQSE